MKVHEIAAVMEYEQDIHIWDISIDDTAALYEGAPKDIPAELLNKDVTGMYLARDFLGIDLD